MFQRIDGHQRSRITRPSNQEVDVKKKKKLKEMVEELRCEEILRGDRVLNHSSTLSDDIGNRGLV